VEEGSGTGTSPYRGPIGGPGERGGGSIYRELTEMDEGESRNGASLSEEAHCGGLLYWVPWVMKGRLWGQASLSIGTPLGNLEGGLSTRDFERCMNEALGMERFSLKRLSA